ncbi:MAG: alanine racemase [Paucimonas sp.]|nr:alanine racemase [Paucimonas sp.]
MPRPLTATIDIDAMRTNLAQARRCVPTARAWAVVKANAYGHGLANAMRAFADANGLALIEFDAAVRLREAGWQRPVLLLEGAFDAADLQAAARHNLALAVHCEDQVRMIELARPQQPLALHLKLNTGMNRLGFRPSQFRSVYERLQAVPHVASISFLTHFANADEEEGESRLPVSRQVELFRQATAGLAGETSVGNSAATLMQASVNGDWIRPGIMLYGGSPGAGTGAQFGLLPAMTLKSRIIAVQDIAAGEAVGYGSRFVAKEPTRIGVVACGYADGYPRSAPDGTPVLVDGQRARLAGRVSMDMLTVDLGPLPSAGLDSEVVLWGQGLAIDEVAQASGTIGYELMCALAQRVPVQVVDSMRSND